MLVLSLLFFSARGESAPKSPSQKGEVPKTIMMQGDGATYIEGDAIYKGATKKEVAAAVKSELSHVEKQLGEIKQLIADKELSAANKNASFQKIVWNLYKKSFDELDAAQKATFWDDLSKYLDKLVVAAANYQQAIQGTVDTDLKALFTQIEQAQANFDYNEQIRLLSSFEEKHAEQTKDLARVFYLKAESYNSQDASQNAERYYRKAAAIEDQNPFFLNAHAKSLKNLKRYGEAEVLLRRSLAISEAKVDTEYPLVVATLNNLGLLFQEQLGYDKAEEFFKRALTITELKQGKAHPDLVTTLNNLAALFAIQYRYEDAAALLRRSLDILDLKNADRYPVLLTAEYWFTIGFTHANLVLLPDHITFRLDVQASLLEKQGKYKDAESLYRRSMAICEKVDYKLVTVGTGSIRNLACLLKKEGEYAEAEQLFRNLLVRDEKKYGKNEIQVAYDLRDLGDLLIIRRKYAEAEPFLRRELAIIEANLGADHPDVEMSLTRLAGVLEEQGKYAEAELMSRRSLAISRKSVRGLMIQSPQDSTL